MEHKKIIISVMVICLLAVSLVVAGWALNFNRTSRISVTSENPLSFTENFALTSSLDTTNSSQFTNRTVIVENDNGLILGNINASLIIFDLIDGCNPSEGEIILTTELTNSSGTFNIENNETSVNFETLFDTSLKFTVTAARQSCPADVNLTLAITPILS